jgi:anaerobic magnesium-protoporphyrin IX monomethyl ester cyclase
LKIGLVDPGSKKIILNENFPHLGLASIAAFLERQGHSVTILDLSVEGEAGLDRLLESGLDLIGFSATSFTFARTIELAKRVKDSRSEIVTLVGGPHVPIGMETVLDSTFLDYAVCGEGEVTASELVEFLQRKRKPGTASLSAIQGLIFKDDDGRIVVNPMRPRIDDLDDLPFPAFHLFRMERYGIYPLLTSRGCPFGCTFCSIKAIWGTRWRYRSPDNIIMEIDRARDEFNWVEKPFSVIDDSFNIIPKRIEEFCAIILERNMNIQWFSAGFRADKISLSLARKMKEAGCIGVAVGIESANNEVLRTIKKKETIEDIEKGCQNLFQAGIPVQAQFMIGNPGDTLETVKESLEFAKKQRFASTAFYLALPYPKTELWDYVKEHGRFLKQDYMQFHHFSDEPVFETPEFSASERTAAYRLGRKLSIKTKLREEARTKLTRIRRLDFQGLSTRRIGKAVVRLAKHFLDLSFRRREEV